MKLTSKVLLLISGIIAVGMLECTPDVAGGSGVGNPTTEVTLSMRILDDDNLITAMSKKRYSTFESNLSLKKGVDIRDDINSQFRVTSALITVSRVKFFSETEETPWVDGPFVFDAISGESDPSLVSIDIPSGIYSGIKMHVTKSGSLSTSESVIEVSGTFEYLGETRAFMIALKCNLHVKYSLETGTLELKHDEKMNLTVVLDADQWLAGTSIIECIGSHCIELQSDGSLLIEETIAPGPCHSNENLIRHNILYSGMLIIS